MNPTLSVKIRDLAPKKEFYIFDKKIKVWQNCYMESSTIMLWKKESVSHRSQWATLRGGSNRWRTDSTKHTERLRQLRAIYDARALLSFLGTPLCGWTSTSTHMIHACNASHIQVYNAVESRRRTIFSRFTFEKQETDCCIQISSGVPLALMSKPEYYWKLR